MKIKFTGQIQVIIIIIVQLSFVNAFGSQRFIDNVFEDVTVIRDVIYARHTNNEFMKMDIYLPEGDNLENRPAIIFAHGGAFVIGDKNDLAIRELCKVFARKGYVTASINYRLAHYPSLLKMGYQAVQDGKAAVRFIRHNAGNYGIDQNHIFFGGISAGSITALNVAFLKDDEDLAGKQYKYSLGCLECSGNNFSESSSVCGVINICGGMLDLLHIDNDENIPVISFHGTEDDVVSIDRALPFKNYMSYYNSIVRFVDYKAQVEPLYGSRQIHGRLDALHIKNELFVFQGKGHRLLFDEDGQMTDLYFSIVNNIKDFLFDQLKPPTPVLNGPAVVKPNSTYKYFVQNLQDLSANWYVQGGKIKDKTDQFIEIQWNYTTNAKLSVTFTNTMDIRGDPNEIDVMVEPQTTTPNHRQQEITNNNNKRKMEEITDKAEYFILNFTEELDLKTLSSLLLIFVASIMIYFGLKKPK